VREEMAFVGRRVLYNKIKLRREEERFKERHQIKIISVKSSNLLTFQLTLTTSSTLHVRITYLLITVFL
jgi:hypothetical protein